MKISKEELRKLSTPVRSLALQIGYPYPNWTHFKGVKLNDGSYSDLMELEEKANLLEARTEQLFEECQR